jgi:hypothetical protein
MGRNATASDPGTFVFGDRTSDPIESQSFGEARFQVPIISQGRIEGNEFEFDTDFNETRSIRFRDTGSGNYQWEVSYFTNFGSAVVDMAVDTNGYAAINSSAEDKVRLLVAGDSSDDTKLFEVRDDGTTKFVVNDGGGTSVGTSDTPPLDGLLVEGDIESNGNKNFVQTVDTDDGQKEVVYTAAESGTAHTEQSGVAQLEDGRAVVELPDHFGMVTSDDDPLIVQVTPHASDPVRPQVTERSTDRIVIEDVAGDNDYEVSYTVRGTRDGYEDKQVVRDPRAEQATSDPAPADD